MSKINYKKASEFEIIELAQNDDLKALEELIKRIQKEVFGLFSHLCRGRYAISDLTQETLVKVARNIKKLKDIKSFKTWLNRIALNVFYDNQRKLSKNNLALNLEEIDSAHMPDTKSEPFEKCLASELGCLIKNSILSLPTNSRIAIVLREIEGMSYDDIANLTHTNIGTVKSRICRARLKLQQELNNYI